MPFHSLLLSPASYFASVLIVTCSVADPMPAPGAKFLQPLPKKSARMDVTPASLENYSVEGSLSSDTEAYGNLNLSSELAHHLNCDADCLYKGEIHSCRDRIEWLRGTGWTLHDSIEQVSDECQKQCSCRYDEFPIVPATPAPQTPHPGWMAGQPLCDVRAVALRYYDKYALYNKYHRQYLSTDGHNVNLFHSLWEGAFWELQYTPRGYYLVNVWQRKYMDSWELTKDNQKNVHLWVGNGLDDHGRHPENHRWYLEAGSCSFYITHDASGQQLDVHGGNVQLFDAHQSLHGAPDLEWQLIPIHVKRL